MASQNSEAQTKKSFPFRRVLVALGIFIFITLCAGGIYRYLSASSEPLDIDKINAELARAHDRLPGGLILHSSKKEFSTDFSGGQSSLLDGVELSARPVRLSVSYEFTLKIQPSKEVGLSLSATDDGYHLFVPAASINSVLIDWKNIKISPQPSSTDFANLVDALRDPLTLYISSIISNDLKSPLESVPDLQDQLHKKLESEFPDLKAISQNKKTVFSWALDQDPDDGGDKN